MKTKVFFLFTVIYSLFTVHCRAQVGTVGGPLSYHVWFNAVGNRMNEAWGSSSIDTLPGLSDSIPHPISIGENMEDGVLIGHEFSSYILNRYVLDTAQYYAFPGSFVVPGNFNGDSYSDFVVITGESQGSNLRVIVLFGTSKPDSFVTAMVLHEQPAAFAGGPIAVADCNLDGYDLILSERNFSLDTGATSIGRIALFLGGPGMSMDTVPAQTLYGVNRYNPVGGQMMCGKIRDATHEYICEERGGHSSDLIATYLCCPDFQLLPTDTIWCADSGAANGGFLVTEATGDSVDDILLGSQNQVFIYAGGKNISSTPSFLINYQPFYLFTGDFGSVLTDVGDVSGNGYHYLLASAPGAQGYGGGTGGGDVFLYPLQRGLKDTCVGWAGLEDDASGLGLTAAAVGDVNGDGLADFYCGAISESNAGRIVAFLGDPSYGQPVAVKEPPSVQAGFILNQNYPNPFTYQTNIPFTISDRQLWGSLVTLKIYNALGEELYTAFNQKADGATYTIRVNGAGMPEGNYFYRLSCGGLVSTKMFSVMR